MTIKRNIEIVTAELNKIGSGKCRLIAVSKTHPASAVQEAYDAGQRIFGENKVQEMTGKYEDLPKDIEWHMIGHLQTNKVKFITPFVSLIHSVDSPKLADEINKQGRKIDRVINCLLQVHIAQEETKFGFDANELLDFVQSENFRQYSHMSVKGLMGMASLTEDKEKIRREFRGLKELYTKLRAMSLPSFVQLSELSMGMSSDYKIAVEEGSTFVRIGTALFGTRPIKTQTDQAI